MTRYQLTKATALSTVLLSAVPPALAQQTASSEAMGEIIVTARRYEERLQDVPISISVFNQEELTARNIYNAGDLGIYVPSLATNSKFGPEKSSFAIRGFTQEGKTSPSVAVYFADVVAPRSNGGTTSGNGAGVGQLFDLQNVQVLKGPQGTLFGRNTTGGAVLLVPQRPTDKVGGFVEGSIGDYDMHRIQAVLNAPLSEKIRVRGGVDWNERDGYLRNRSGIGPSHLGNTNYIAGRLSLVVDLSPTLENYTVGTFSDSDTYGVVPKILLCDTSAAPVSALAPLGCAQVARQNARGDGWWDVENSAPNPRMRFKQWQVINTTTWQASDDLTVKNIFSYARFQETSSFSLFGDNYFVPAGAVNIPVTTIQLYPGFSGHNSHQWTLTEELQIQGRSMDGRLRWQAGGYLESSKPIGFNSGLTNIFLNCTSIYTYQCTGSGVLSASQVKDSFNNKGLYAQGTYDITEQFSVTAGFRYTMDRMRGEAENMNIAVPVPGTPVLICQNRVLFNGGSLLIPRVVTNSSQCNQVNNVNSNRPTWLIDFDYKPSDDTLLYAKWARGHRQGAINSNNVGLETSGPEKVDTFEIGVKTSFRGAMPGYFNVAAFYNNFRNQQIAVNSVVAPAFATAISPAQPIVNAGKSRIWGFEVDLSLTLFQGFKLDAAYAYLDTKLISITLPVTPVYYAALIPSAQVGQPLALSPKNRFSLTGTYTLPSSSLGTPWLGATFSHTDANNAVSPAVSPLARLKASNLLNLNAGLNEMFGKPIDLTFFMTNVTNEKLLVFPNSSIFTIGADGGNVNEPRMFGFRLKYRFEG